MDHRGRIQLQGKDLGEEDSRPWARETPYPLQDGRAAVEELEGACTDSQLKRRVQAFAKMRRLMKNANASGGLPAPFSKACQNYPKPQDYKDARLDLEVKVGLAFV